MTNAVEGRAPWSDDYNGRLTDELNALLGTDSSSFVYESVSVVSVLVSIASAGSAAGKVPDRTSKSANGPSKCDGLTHSSSGIASYSTQRAITTGHRGAVQAHRLIERRIARQIGGNTDDWATIVVTKSEHRGFTDAWRQANPYGDGTRTASRAKIENAARQIYADYPEVLQALE